MTTGKFALWRATLLIGLAASWFSGAGLTATGNAETPPSGLGNASCLSCHDGKKGKLEVPDADGAKRALRNVDRAKFAQSLHSTMECIACHQEIGDSATPHRKTPGEKKPDCLQCHLEVAKTPTNYKTAGQRRSLRSVVENIEAYKSSSHGKPNRDDPSKLNASCSDCHNVHSFDVPPRDSPARAEWRLGVSAMCGTCHDAQLEEWAESVHGRQVNDKRNPKAANCVDCHSAHKVGKPSSNAVKLAITASCGNCHDQAYSSYRATYHGQVATLGYAHTAKCFDCHGGHDIEPSKDPKSKMHLDNRLETCRKCHSEKRNLPRATAGFVSFSPHGTTNDFSAYPQIWIANKMMVGLLVGTFAFFWLHTLLWFYREFRERRQRRGQAHVALAGLPDIPAGFQGKHFQRFSLTWRIAHLVFALSLMLLTLTGISLFYPEAPWAKPLIDMLGGPKTAGIIHRVNAVIFAAVFFWHLVVVGVKIARDWKNFKIFGPNSLIPGLQDLKDIIAMFKWFLGKAPRPVFDRWTYWEKFDYWAPFWGVTIIGVSGLMMWFPHVTAEYLPGWVFNVATIFHSEEAFLAVVFLFTVHFFNNHFRPDKFPLDRVMFTGTVTLDELRHEHPLQYQRLVESGELEKHLVDAPTPKFVKASSVLGFTLIVIGLILLTLVAIGFFTSAH
jgi:cytochrome b subunit of formate dehydrogenase